MAVNVCTAKVRNSKQAQTEATKIPRQEITATNKKSKKSAGFAKRKRQTKRPLQRTGKHKKSAPHVKNLAALVSKDKGDRRAIAIECAKKARERSAKKPSRGAKDADAMEE